MDLGRGPDIVDGLREVHDKIKDVREAEGGGQVKKNHGKTGKKKNERTKEMFFRLDMHGEIEHKI